MFVGNNAWQSKYSAKHEAQTVEYILAENFDGVFLADLKESFENCLRTDSGNNLVAPFNFYNFRGINLGDPTNDSDAVNVRFLKESIYRFEAIKTEQETISGIYQLKLDNPMLSIVQGGPITFQLPTPSNLNTLNQFMIDLKTDADGSAIDVGTELYFDKTAVSFAANSYYTVIWEYSNLLGGWVCGILPKGAAI